MIVHTYGRMHRWIQERHQQCKKDMSHKCALSRTKGRRDSSFFFKNFRLVYNNLDMLLPTTRYSHSYGTKVLSPARCSNNGCFMRSLATDKQTHALCLGLSGNCGWWPTRFITIATCAQGGTCRWIVIFLMTSSATTDKPLAFERQKKPQAVVKAILWLS